MKRRAGITDTTPRATGSLAAVIVAIATVSLALRAASDVIHRPITEDGYYAFSIARNIALGRGVTIDGTTGSNGFQPLFVFLIAPISRLTGGEVAPLRLVLLFHAIVFVASAFLFADILGRIVEPVSRSRARAWAIVAYLGSMYLFWQHFNGLETGVVLLCYLLVTRVWLTVNLQALRGWAVLGVALGLLVLARIDALFFAGLVGLCALLRGGAAGRKIQVSGALLCAGVVAVITGPWWGYNYRMFGSFVPTSGRAQQLWMWEPRRVFEAAHATLTTLAPSLYLAGGATLRSGAIYAVLVLANVAVFMAFGRNLISRDSADAAPVRRLFQLLVLLGVAMLILETWYIASFWAMHFYRRYFAPMALPAIGMTALSAAALSVRWRALDLPARALMLAPTLALVALLWIRPNMGRSEFIDQQVALVREHVPADQRVAAYQSGSLAYFVNGAVNLDGKVNLEAYLHRDNIAEYVSDRNIRWFCDWPGYVQKGLGTNPSLIGWRQRGERGNFVIFERVDGQAASQP